MRNKININFGFQIFLNKIYFKSLIKSLSLLILFGFSSATSTEKFSNEIIKNRLDSFEIGQNNSKYLANIKWEKFSKEKKIIWEDLEEGKETDLLQNKFTDKNKDLFGFNINDIGSLNRSIVFDDYTVGPDINWLIPPAFKWNSYYKFDTSLRGHSGRFDKGRNGKSFWGWNNGDAVGQFYYQFLDSEKISFGLNLGIRSVYSGSEKGGSTAIGEGQSLGFRIDRKISATEGFAFGAEQLLHLDGKTDTGRDIYLTLSKAIWNKNKTGQFPLDIYTFGVATGRMAEGNIKFLCSDLLGGSGTEENHQRRLCWAPVFSISRVFNKKISTFFEYNSKWFLLGSSIAPFNEIPLRGTFAVQLSDHIDNYKLNNFEDLKWVFRLSLGI